MFPFFDNKIAMDRVDGMCAKIIINITEIGTLKIIPNIPHKAPQNDSPIITTKGLTFNESPVSFGSIKFPITNCIPPTIIKTHTPGINSPYCSMANTEGKIVAIREPIVGIKFIRKIRNAQNSGTSTPINSSAI